MSLYPINLKIENSLCLVVGGGVVAFRKIRGLLQADARVRVISPELLPGLRLLADNGAIEWFERPFVEGDLEGVSLVFAATNKRKVQVLVQEEACKNKVLLNSADAPVESDFHVPAHFRRGPMIVTVSTGGGSPALAKKLRKQLEDEIVPEYQGVVELMAIIREGVISISKDQSVSGGIFRSLLEGNLVEYVLEENWFDLQMLLLQKLPEELDSVILMKTFLERQDHS
ncbi:MAG: precorrin-2 dehydrogenase/sirohydrochlorin ferrochelatase [Desulforhopalus sp.]|jgi:precorrin-2 dehydrogenase/sirohydrochlorin ferrochelatase